MAQVEPKHTSVAFLLHWLETKLTGEVHVQHSYWLQRALPANNNTRLLLDRLVYKELRDSGPNSYEKLYFFFLKLSDRPTEMTHVTARQTRTVNSTGGENFQGNQGSAKPFCRSKSLLASPSNTQPTDHPMKQPRLKSEVKGSQVGSAKLVKTLAKPAQGTRPV